MLADLGAYVIDADSVGHAVLAGLARDEVARVWPEVVIDGSIDRRRLATIVFGDPAQLRRLESITHPYIRSRVADLERQSLAEVVVVELPVLSGILDGRRLRAVVDTPDRVRLTRLVARGMDEADALARMRSQPSRVEWLEAADFVIDNSGDMADLTVQTLDLLRLVEGCHVQEE